MCRAIGSSQNPDAATNHLEAGLCGRLLRRVARALRYGNAGTKGRGPIGIRERVSIRASRRRAWRLSYTIRTVVAVDRAICDRDNIGR